MKAITMRMQKFSQPGVILMATVVAIITSMVVANATQSITTPNAAFISYNLAIGANSAPRLRRPPADQCWSWAAAPRGLLRE